MRSDEYRDYSRLMPSVFLALLLSVPLPLMEGGLHHSKLAMASIVLNSREYVSFVLICPFTTLRVPQE